MPFARYFCIFINVGLGEGAAWPVGEAEQQPPDTSPSSGPGCNGNVVIAEADAVLTQVDTANICPALRVKGIRGNDDALSVSKKSDMPSAKEPFVVPIYVLVAIIPVSLTA
ncbi:hypothetical protein G690_02528 [Escherichia coli HVH 12 (4-7653042)]|nr:hypothetical protein G690_02528 [Escherichia coli HVH 12 (4-7653042)]